MLRISAHNFIDKDDYFGTLIKKISLKNFKNICLCYISNPVVIKMLIEKFSNCNITVIDLGYICNKIKKAFPNVEVIANDFQNESDNKDEEPIVNILKSINNMFDLIIANSPYNIGNFIISEAIKHLTDNGIASVLMPLSYYNKKDELYRYIEDFELANPKLFQDAVITENLCICTLNKKEINKYSWMDLVLESVDQKYIEYYKWNIEHYKGLIMKRGDYKKPEDFDVYTDFWETCKCFSSLGGGGFGSNGGGYKWNVLYDNSKVNAGIGCIHFDTKLAKDNFCKWWYFGKKGERLASKVALGIHMGGSVGPNTRIAIPQIEWTLILDKYPNYEKDPDTYVLKEMGLKLDENGVIVKE
jgi:hypothetical protein